MIILQTCKFAQNQSSSYVSKSYFNSAGDVLSVQVEGGDGKYYIEGRTLTSMDWIPLAAINLADFSVAKDGITKAGIYELGIAGIRELRGRVETVNGEVTIMGQIISTGEA